MVPGTWYPEPGTWHILSGTLILKHKTYNENLTGSHTPEQA